MGELVKGTPMFQARTRVGDATGMRRRVSCARPFVGDLEATGHGEENRRAMSTSDRLG